MIMLYLNKFNIIRLH